MCGDKTYIKLNIFMKLYDKICNKIARFVCIF